MCRYRTFPSSQKILLGRAENVTTSLQEVQETEEHYSHSMRIQSPNPGCRKLYWTNDPGLSPNKLQGEKWGWRGRAYSLKET